MWCVGKRVSNCGYHGKQASFCVDCVRGNKKRVNPRSAALATQMSSSSKAFVGGVVFTIFIHTHGAPSTRSVSVVLLMRWKESFAAQPNSFDVECRLILIIAQITPTVGVTAAAVPTTYLDRCYYFANSRPWKRVDSCKIDPSTILMAKNSNNKTESFQFHF